MKEKMNQYGIPILIAFMSIEFLKNNVSINNFEGLLEVVIFSNVILIFITCLISIIRTVKEKNKMKIIPCVAISILAILAFIVYQCTIYFDIQIFAEIGLIIFIYEMVDLFDIRFSKESINIISLIMFILFIILYLSIQLVSINEYKKSYNSMIKLIKSYNNFSDVKLDEFDSLIVERKKWEGYSEQFNDRSFITEARSYKILYSLYTPILESNVNYLAKNKKNFTANKEKVLENIENIVRANKKVNESIIFTILNSLIIAMIEVMILLMSNKKTKNVNSN